MLTKDQRERLGLLRTMAGDDVSKKEALQALEENFWDTAMALEWIRRKKVDADASIEEFHQKYEVARAQAAAALPEDRYDVADSKKQGEATNRAARRAAKKNKNKKK